MSSRKPTPEQQKAIDAAGEVLVSASAGSGKTFVMIEKMIALILSGQADVSSVMAVTFTKLAAAEMKERLRAALVRSVNEAPAPAVRARLKAQIADIGTADVCTLHAFCTNVIRRYFYEIGIEGNFRIIDEAEAKKLQQRAVAQTFESLLEGKSPLFAQLGNVYAGSRGFKNLGKTLLEAYARVRSRDDYTAFLQQLPGRYDEAHFDALAEEMFGSLRARAERLRAECARLEEEMQPYREAGLFGEKHAVFLAERRQMAEEAIAAPDLFAAAGALTGAALGSKPPNTKIKKSGDPAALALDARFAALKERAGELKELAAPFRTRKEELGAFLASGEIAAGLCELIAAFDGIYTQIKRRAGGLDFADLEHCCLALLAIPHVREAVTARYTHVFVDEYQDVNPAQERILALVGGKNVFMVGDAKQSIYGFRGCSAAFFTQKYEDLLREGRALTLNGNFRSCSAVLGAVNKIFSRCMTRESCSIDYAATSMMAPGSPAQAGGEVRVEFVPEEEKEAPPERGVYSVAAHLAGEDAEGSAEGALIAELVLQEAASRRHDPAAGGPVQNSLQDIVVLTRNSTARTQRIIRALVRRGIPVATAAEVNLCDYPEVRAMLAILQFLDNGAQDIPAAAALKSAMGGLSDEDLAQICLQAEKDEPFYAACERLARGEGGLAGKLAAFFARAEKYRLRMCVQSAAELMAFILSDTGMEAQQLAMPCGAERVRRLSRLIAAAGDASVPAFLDRLKNGENKLGYSESGGENAVRVMTMHASKGLEFPVVIVAGLNERFSDADMKDMLFDDEWGFAPKAYDQAAHVASETLLRAVVRRRLLRRRAEDEMRLLYVALTRAKSRLHLVFSQENEFDAAAVAEAKCFADFIDLSLLQEDYAPVAGAAAAAPAGERAFAAQADEEAMRAVLESYRQPYPFAASLGLPVKTSPSQLLREQSMPPAEEVEAPDEFYDSDADAAHGTAYHAFLELADFSAPAGQEIGRVCALLPPEQAALLDAARLKAVLQMPVFAQLQGYTLYREREFLALLPAGMLYDTPAQDEVLVQGVIDLLAVRGQECIVVDYKYSSHPPEKLLADYAVQLKIYAAAARRAGARTVRAYIVNILRGYTVQVPPEELCCGE